MTTLTITAPLDRNVAAAVALEQEWETHVDEHSFADGTADPRTCGFCAEREADGSWTDDLVG
jgi:hypothetical protein